MQYSKGFYSGHEGRVSFQSFQKANQAQAGIIQPPCAILIKKINLDF